MLLLLLLLLFYVSLYVLWMLTFVYVCMYEWMNEWMNEFSSAHDIPEKSKCVEIYNCFNYMKMRLHWNGCGLLLHEYCHLIHQCCLPSPQSPASSLPISLPVSTGLYLDSANNNGLYNVTVINSYETAKRSNLYDNVLRRDWAGKNEDYDMGM